MGYSCSPALQKLGQKEFELAAWLRGERLLKSLLGKHNCGLKDLSLNILQSAGVIEQSTGKPEVDGPPTRGADALHSYCVGEPRLV